MSLCVFISIDIREGLHVETVHEGVLHIGQHAYPRSTDSKHRSTHGYPQDKSPLGPHLGLGLGFGRAFAEPASRRDVYPLDDPFGQGAHVSDSSVVELHLAGKPERHGDGLFF